jgi:hypothetical protein
MDSTCSYSQAYIKFYLLNNNNNLSDKHDLRRPSETIEKVNKL